MEECMRRLDTGELLADEKFIFEEYKKMQSSMRS
jgi:hypothetical protein